MDNSCSLIFKTNGPVGIVESFDDSLVSWSSDPPGHYRPIREDDVDYLRGKLSWADGQSQFPPVHCSRRTSLVYMYKVQLHESCIVPEAQEVVPESGHVRDQIQRSEVDRVLRHQRYDSSTCLSRLDPSASGPAGRSDGRPITVPRPVDWDTAAYRVLYPGAYERIDPCMLGTVRNDSEWSHWSRVTAQPLR